jgi:hypothetical protein
MQDPNKAASVMMWCALGKLTKKVNLAFLDTTSKGIVP